MNSKDQIHQLVTSTDNAHVILSNGVHVQFKHPDNVSSHPRVFVYRVGEMPSRKELDEVLAALTAVLPAGMVITEQLRACGYPGNGGSRHGKIIYWQAALIDASAPSLGLNYTEANEALPVRFRARRRAGISSRTYRIWRNCRV